MFLCYTGVETLDGSTIWLFNGTDLSKRDLYYNVATIDYVRDHTGLNHENTTTLYNTNVTLTKSLIDYLTIKYPPC